MAIVQYIYKGTPKVDPNRCDYCDHSRLSHLRGECSDRSYIDGERVYTERCKCIRFHEPAEAEAC